MATKAKKPAAKKAVIVYTAGEKVSGKTVAVVPLRFTGRVNDAVKITEGKLAGAVGKVQSIEAGGAVIQVLVQGIHNGQPVDSLDTYGPAWLEVV
jgi:transcription antitermination factor NusG